MFGVVLWSDTADRQAVIWCQDHGELAFYDQPQEDLRLLTLDPGDLVRFDLTTDQTLRRAHNPTLVAEGAYTALPDALGPSDAVKSVPSRDTAQIIPFTAPKTRREDRPDHTPSERGLV